jgi:hypothetical protein
MAKKEGGFIDYYINCNIRIRYLYKNGKELY